MKCKQKFCKFCVKPYFSLDRKFINGNCSMQKYVILDSYKEEAKKYEIQPLYCNCYRPRKRKINY